jgi:hypothetical protein
VAVVAPGSGAPTGTVTFEDGSITLGMRKLDARGTVSLTTSSLRPGRHSITVAYNGSTEHKASTSAALAHTVKA